MGYAALQQKDQSMNFRMMMQSGPAKANELFSRLADTSDGAVKTRERLFAELRAELDQFTKLKRVTDSVRYADLPDAVWETYWSSLYRKTERGLGWLLFSAGAILLGAYGIFQMLNTMYYDTRISWFVKIGVTGLMLGLVILLVSLIRERLFAYKNDRYREVAK